MAGPAKRCHQMFTNVETSTDIAQNFEEMVGFLARFFLHKMSGDETAV
jgi:hypothetical protein